MGQAWGKIIMKNINVPELIDTILHGLDEKEIRKAKMTLWHLMQGWSICELKEFVAANPSKYISELAEWHMWHQNLDTGIDNLLHIIQYETNTDKVCEAIYLIGELKYSQAIGYLTEILVKSDNIAIQDAVAITLTELSQESILPRIMELINERPNNCDSLVSALLNIDCTNIANFLIDLFIAQPKAYYMRLLIIRIIGKLVTDGKIDSQCDMLCSKLFLVSCIDEDEVKKQTEELIDTLSGE